MEIESPTYESAPILSVLLDNKVKLYASYMPFIKGGGLFIATNVEYAVNQAINLEIKLMDEPEVYEVDGKIVWITPRDAQRGKTPGIGVALKGANATLINNKIETYLAGIIDSHMPTETM